MFSLNNLARKGLIPTWAVNMDSMEVNTCPMKCGMKILMHDRTSSDESLKLVNGWKYSSHAL